MADPTLPGRHSSASDQTRDERAKWREEYFREQAKRRLQAKARQMRRDLAPFKLNLNPGALINIVLLTSIEEGKVSALFNSIDQLARVARMDRAEASRALDWCIDHNLLYRRRLKNDGDSIELIPVSNSKFWKMADEPRAKDPLESVLHRLDLNCEFDWDILGPDFRQTVVESMLDAEEEPTVGIPHAVGIPHGPLIEKKKKTEEDSSSAQEGLSPAGSDRRFALFCQRIDCRPAQLDDWRERYAGSGELVEFIGITTEHRGKARDPQPLRCRWRYAEKLWEDWYGKPPPEFAAWLRKKTEPAKPRAPVTVTTISPCPDVQPEDKRQPGETDAAFLSRMLAKLRRI
jgi:hypothetical protein